LALLTFNFFFYFVYEILIILWDIQKNTEGAEKEALNIEEVKKDKKRSKHLFSLCLK